MAATKTIRVGDQDMPAAYLSDEARADFETFVAAECRRQYNPFVEFAAKVQALPEHLQVAAVQQFVYGLDFSACPDFVVKEVLASVPVIRVLGQLVTGQDCVTEENAAELYPQLVPFIRREELVIEGRAQLEQINAQRIQEGLPPLPTGG